MIEILWFLVIGLCLVSLVYASLWRAQIRLNKSLYLSVTLIRDFIANNLATKAELEQLEKELTKAVDKPGKSNHAGMFRGLSSGKESGS
jgi:hypothetical protein